MRLNKSLNNLSIFLRIAMFAKCGIFIKNYPFFNFKSIILFYRLRKLFFWSII